MTSSLVGSEMCIRDSPLPVPVEPMKYPAEKVHFLRLLLQVGHIYSVQAVSYTHLTLPTICSV
eukprot:8806372-Prorocentrum_lima.AAC.1